MWLIDARDIECLRLEEFLGDPPDSYAILSHTWSSNEVTFEQFTGLQPSPLRVSENQLVHEDTGLFSSSGFQKIKGAASLAKSQGFTYLWVDTCCINKASSAELSESINSMYRWYQQAEVCFAYLSDVSSGSIRNLSQELIAPRVVEFYAADWSFIDTKMTGNDPFCGVLSDITGIDLDILAGRMALDDTSIASKMRWAAKRKTKRREDIAYCLLGLFDVNMPLLYGEGSKAFRRLQEEILKETNDQSIFLWAIDPGSSSEMDHLHGLLANSPESFSRLELNHVRPMPPLESNESVPVSITSQGLRTSMLLIPIVPEGDDYYAVLDCTVSTAYSPLAKQAPCIVLRRLWGDQFARIPWSVPYGVQFVRNDFDGFQRGGVITTIYVKQNPFYILPEISIRTYIQGDHKEALSSSLSIIEAFPADCFSTTQSIVRTGEPQSGRAIVTLRLGQKTTQLVKPLFDVSVGLLRSGKRWEVQYEKHPYTGTHLEEVHLKNRQFGGGSGTEVYDSSGNAAVLNIYTTENTQRGRRFVQLEVFCTPQISPVTLTDGAGHAIVSAEAASPKASFMMVIADLVASETRQCCYQDTLCRILSNVSQSPDGVRTRPAERGPDFATNITLDFISEDKPYASMVRAIHDKDLSKIKSLASRNKALIECQAEEFDDFRPIHWVAARWTTQDGFRVIKKLVNFKVNIQSRTRSGWMAIHLAILTENFPVVLYLLEKSKRSRGEWDVATVTGETLSHLLAAYAQDLSWGDQYWMSNTSKGNVIDALVIKRMPETRVNSRGELPIHRAVANGNAAALEIDELLEAGDINAVDNAGRTVLFHAVCGGCSHIIQKILNMGASIEMADSQGRTPMHAAVMARQPNALDMLLDFGADPDATTTAVGLTPLHLACLYGFLDIVEALLETRKAIALDNRKPAALGTWKTAALNCWSTEGSSFQPIHLAVANEHTDCIKKLVKAGCSIDGTCNSYLRLREARDDRLAEAEVIFLPKRMAPLELAMFLGNKQTASLVSALSKVGIAVSP